MDAMATFDVAELRRLDQAHHLHPFTNHKVMHRDGSHVVRTARDATVVDESDCRHEPLFRGAYPRA